MNAASQALVGAVAAVHEAESYLKGLLALRADPAKVAAAAERVGWLTGVLSIELADGRPETARVISDQLQAASDRGTERALADVRGEPR